MVFAAFISASIVRRGIPAYESSTQAYSTQSESLPLPIPLLILDSGVLVANSLSLELARRSSRAAAGLPAGSKPRTIYWETYAAIALTLAFLSRQTMCWRLLQAQGQTISTGARSAFFYLLTGAHAAQIILGLLALGWIVARQSSWTAARRYIAIDLATWYFAAMAVLWICLLLFLMFG
jgi:cytochrome c oxidase subunit III